MGRRWTGFKRQLQLQLIDLDVRLSEFDLKAKLQSPLPLLHNFYVGGQKTCSHSHANGYGQRIASSLRAAATGNKRKYHTLDDSVYVVCRNCGNCAQQAPAHVIELSAVANSVARDGEGVGVCDSDSGPKSQNQNQNQRLSKAAPAPAIMTTLNNSSAGGEDGEGTQSSAAANNTASSTTNSATLRGQNRRSPLSANNTANPRQFLTWSASAANHKLQKLSKNLVSSVAKLQNKMDRVKFPFNAGTGSGNESANGGSMHCESNGTGTSRGRDRNRNRRRLFESDPAAGYLNGIIGTENAYTCGPEEFNNNVVQVHKENTNNFAQNGIPGTSDNVVSLAVVQNLRKRNNHTTSNSNSNNLNLTSTATRKTGPMSLSPDTNTNTNNRNINDNNLSFTSSSSSSSESSSSSSYPKLSTSAQPQRGHGHINGGATVDDDDHMNNFNMLEMRPITAAISKQILSKGNNDGGADNIMNLRSSSSHAEQQQQPGQEWSRGAGRGSLDSTSTTSYSQSRKQRAAKSGRGSSSNNNYDDKVTSSVTDVGPPPSTGQHQHQQNQNKNKARNDTPLVNGKSNGSGGDDDEFGFGCNKVILKGIRSQELHQRSKQAKAVASVNNNQIHNHRNGSSKKYNYNSCNGNGAGAAIITTYNSTSSQSVSSTTPLLLHDAPVPASSASAQSASSPADEQPPPLPATQSPAVAVSAVTTSVIPTKLTVTIFEEESELRHAAWFQGGIPREIALEVLRNEPIGSFIVRESTTKAGCLALSLRVPREFQPTGIAHYLILKTGKGYKIKGFTKEFGSLSSLITHHSVMPELLPCPLSLHLYRTNYSKKTSGRFNSADFVEPEKLISVASMARQFTDF